jgi:FPC/CPF motif-containing protein YcgG
MYKENNMESANETAIEEFRHFVEKGEFPCVAAKAALSRGQIKFYVADHMACPKDDVSILAFLYDFIDEYRSSATQFHTACVIFKGPLPIDENTFDDLLWMRLQALADIDATQNKYDKRVNLDPSSENFSFSIKEEAFFIVGLEPGSSRIARQFAYPALIFNPHAQFEQLREKHTYEKMKNIVRKRDISLSGSINPTLEDFGKSSEAYQYSGVRHTKEWKCPLNIHHGNAHNPAA